MAQAVNKELYLKEGNKYIALGSIVAGKIKLNDGSTYEIGSVEELFELGLTAEDKAFIAQMDLAFPGDANVDSTNAGK